MRKIEKFIVIINFLILSGVITEAQTTEVKTGYQVGDKAPNISIKNTKGKTIELKELEGYVVLVDFWAAWCRPCRMENPNIVEAYNTYRNRKFTNAKGFKIFSVSLDRKKEDWLNAIKTDKLDWKYHGSDLEGWKSDAAKLYHVGSIPANFLLDHNGIIVGKNLRGIDLHYNIEKLAE